MPNKTLSVRDDDLPLWERAARAAERERITVSALVATALAHHLGETGTCSVLIYNRTTTAHIERFEGRWLTDDVPPVTNGEDRPWKPEDVEYHRVTLGKTYGHSDEGYEGGQESQPTDWRVHVAETSRGRIAVYIHHWNHDTASPPELHVFDSLSAAQEALGKDPRVRKDPRQTYGTFWGPLEWRLRPGDDDPATSQRIVWRDI